MYKTKQLFTQFSDKGYSNLSEDKSGDETLSQNYKKVNWKNCSNKKLLFLIKNFF